MPDNLVGMVVRILPKGNSRYETDTLIDGHVGCIGIIAEVRTRDAYFGPVAMRLINVRKTGDSRVRSIWIPADRAEFVATNCWTG